MQERVKPKKKVTLEIDATLAAAAAAKGIDLASFIEQALRAELQEATPRGLSDDDRAAIEFHNRFEAEHGRWTDGLEKL